MKNEEGKKKKVTTKKVTDKKETTSKKSTKGTTSAAKKTQAKKSQPKKKEVVVEEIKKEEKKVEEVIVEEIKKDKKPVKKVKTSDIILVIGLVLVLVLGFLVMGGKSNKVEYELPLSLTGEVGLHQLTYQEYKEKVDNDEAFVLIIERATCSHCVNYMPVAETFADEKGVPMYYVDTDTFSTEDWEGFEKSNSFLRKNNGSWGTPTTLVLVGSEAIDYVVGETDVESLEELYNEYFEMDKE